MHKSPILLSWMPSPCHYSNVLSLTALSRCSGIVLLRPVIPSSHAATLDPVCRKYGYEPIHVDDVPIPAVWCYALTAHNNISHPCAGIIQGSVILGPGFLEQCCTILADISNRIPVGLISARYIPHDPAYRLRGQRTQPDSTVLGIPAERCDVSVILYDVNKLGPLQWTPDPTKYWIKLCRQRNLEAVVPVMPAARCQNILDASTLHVDRTGKLVEVPGIDIHALARAMAAPDERAACINKFIQDAGGDTSALPLPMPAPASVVIRAPDDIKTPAVSLSQVDDMSLGIAWIGCCRDYVAALSLAHAILHGTGDLHLHLDMPAKGGRPQQLERMCRRLVELGIAKSCTMQARNRGLEWMVSAAMTHLYELRYDALVRLEDDILIGPDLLRRMANVLKVSAHWKRPIGLVSAQVTSQPSALRPHKLLDCGDQQIGLHNVNSLEGCTMLRASMVEKGFTLTLDSRKAYNVAWLRKARRLQYDGACIVKPTALVQHIGHRTTVPGGTPVVPARSYPGGPVITLPHFKYEDFYRPIASDEKLAAARILDGMQNLFHPDVYAALAEGVR